MMNTPLIRGMRKADNLRESRARKYQMIFLCVETLHGAPKLKIFFKYGEEHVHLI